MSKNLTLTGVSSYSTPAFRGVVLEKGQTVRVDGPLQEMLEKEERSTENDGITIPFFTEAGEKAHYHYEFLGAEMPVNPNAPRPVPKALPLVDRTGEGVGLGENADRDDDGESKTAPAAKTVQRKRAA